MNIVCALTHIWFQGLHTRINMNRNRLCGMPFFGLFVNHKPHIRRHTHIRPIHTHTPNEVTFDKWSSTTTSVISYGAKRCSASFHELARTMISQVCFHFSKFDLSNSNNKRQTNCAQIHTQINNGIRVNDTQKRNDHDGNDDDDDETWRNKIKTWKYVWKSVKCC